MLTPATRRLILATLSLAGAILACERAEVPITPITAVALTPLPPSFTLAAPPPTEAVNTPVLEAPTATVEVAAAATEIPTEVIPATAPAETPTSVVADTPTPEAPTEAPTATSEALPVPTKTLPPAPTETQPVPTTAPPVGPNPAGIPSNATLTQQFTVSNEGGSVFGRPQDMADKRNETWASLRGGNAAWIFDLGGPQNVAGVRLYAHRDIPDDTTLIGIDVSSDGTNWIAVFSGAGDCGAPSCDTLPKDTFTEIGLGPISAQWVRLRGGPTRFAFAEVQIAVIP